MATGVPASTAQTPSTQSFGELKREVADFVRAPDDPEALAAAGLGINNALRKLNMRQWWWSVAFQSISLVQDQMDYPLSPDFKRSMMLKRLTLSGHSNGWLRYYEPHEFEEKYPQSDVGGSPSAATIYNALSNPSLSLDVGPSASFVNEFPTIQHIYYRKYPMYARDRDPVDVPTEAQLYLIWYGREELCAIYRPQLFGLARSERMQVWTELVADQSEHHTSNWSH